MYYLTVEDEDLTDMQNSRVAEMMSLSLNG